MQFEMDLEVYTTRDVTHNQQDNVRTTGVLWRLFLRLVLSAEVQVVDIVRTDWQHFVVGGGTRAIACSLLKTIRTASQAS